MSQTLWTVGHSTRPIDNFISLLKTQGIQRLVDIRTVPRSRHNLRFNTEALATSLAEGDISYRRTTCLGGLRKPRKDSINRGWRNDSFRNYADCMQSAAFASALEERMADSQELRTAIMCAEAASLQCHRSLIADASATRDWQVRHIEVAPVGWTVFTSS